MIVHEEQWCASAGFPGNWWANLTSVPSVTGKHPSPLLAKTAAVSCLQSTIGECVSVQDPFCFGCVAIQLLSRVLLFATPWTAACQASLTFTISWSLLKLMSIESVMPFKHLVLCCPPLLLVAKTAAMSCLWPTVHEWVLLQVHFCFGCVRTL